MTTLSNSKNKSGTSLQKNRVKRIERDLSHNLNKKAFWVCTFISIGLLITSFFMPPIGVIDSSVLAGVGELFAFATLGTVISALRKGNDITLTKGDMSVHIDNDEDMQ